MNDAQQVMLKISRLKLICLLNEIFILFAIIKEIPQLAVMGLFLFAVVNHVVLFNLWEAINEERMES